MFHHVTLRHATCGILSNDTISPLTCETIAGLQTRIARSAPHTNQHDGSNNSRKRLRRPAGTGELGGPGPPTAGGLRLRR